MASIGSLDGSTSATGTTSSGPPPTYSADLAKLETQLSDWVNCPSGKTSTGKAKIAEITDKIDAIKAKVQKAEVEKTAPAPGSETQEAQRVAMQGLRLDGLGAWVNERA